MFDDEQEATSPTLPERPTDGVERLTPEGWGKKLGHYKEPKPYMPQLRAHYDWRHAAAESLHGWKQQAYHYQNEPFLITRADYEAALEAAAEYPVKPAHEPALAPLLKLKKEKA